MKLFLILRKNSNKTTVELLEKAAQQKQDVAIKLIYSDDFDFTSEVSLAENDALYCLSDDAKSRLVEKFIINDKVKSFYKNSEFCYDKVDDADDLKSFFVHRKENLPTIDTVVALSRDKQLLKKYVDALGGYPIIIKCIGGSHGVGTMKIDSEDSLSSIVDYLLSTNGNFIMKRFIEVQTHLRLTVIGNEVVDAIEYLMPSNDFRTNAGSDLIVRRAEPNPEAKDIAVRAVNSLGYELGGVDLLIDKGGNVNIAEVNFPCFFPRSQMLTGTDIASKIIEYLQSK